MVIFVSVLMRISTVERKLYVQYDTRCYFNVRSKADMSQLNLPPLFLYSAGFSL